MTKSSLNDAAFEGFRITRENPLAVAMWAVIVLIGSAITTAAIDSTGAVPAVMAVLKTSPPNFNQLNQVSLKFLPAIRVVLPVALIMGALIQSAVNRAVLRPSNSAFGYLRLSLDEIRTLFVRVGVSLIIAAIYMICIILIAVLAGLLGAFGALIGLIAFFAMLALITVIAVRLSLSVSASFAEKRFAFDLSWALTKGRFWPLFGIYVITIILWGVVLVLGQVIAAAVAAALGGPPGTSMADMLKPAGLVTLALTSIVQTMADVILFGASAGIYRALTADKAEQAF